MLELDDAIGREQIDRNEHDARDDKRDIDGEIDVAPIGRERRKPPGAHEVKDQ